VGQKVRCPSCDGTRVDTRQVRELAGGATFRRRMPLVRFILCIPIASLMTVVSFKAALLVLAIGGVMAGLARWHNNRGLARSVPKEVHTCRQCGYTWKHAPGEPEPLRAPEGPRHA